MEERLSKSGTYSNSRKVVPGEKNPQRLEELKCQPIETQYAELNIQILLL